MPNAPSASAPPSVQVRRTFNATAQRVFAAWTTAEALKRWHAPAEAVVEAATVDFRVGGRYAVHMRGPDGSLHIVTGEYREIDPPRRIVLTWQWHTPQPGEESLVIVEFHANDAGTEIVLTHQGLTTEQSRDGHRFGWVSCLEKLDPVVRG